MKHIWLQTRFSFFRIPQNHREVMMWQFGKRKDPVWSWLFGCEAANSPPAEHSCLQAAADVSQAEITSFSLGNKFHSNKMHKNKNWNKW